ncbi:hypothetical protein DMA11_15945 [Marinilabiliaceae bacterium JC017]|nr:hypothetical protein DMA11_15945 [Marinilabiliaceae bacterium JC017]
MKISRIIFISYFSVIGLCLLSLMVMGFVYNDKEFFGERGEAFETITEELEPFSHISVDDDCIVAVQTGETNSLLYHYNKKDKAQPVYEVRNDTLFVISTRNVLYGQVDLMVGKIKSISGRNCRISLYDIHQDDLFLAGENARINLGHKVDFGSLNVLLKDSSELNYWHFNAKELRLNIQNNSRFRCHSDQKVELLEGKISNNSKATLPDAKRIQLDVDESSKVEM